MISLSPWIVKYLSVIYLSCLFLFTEVLKDVIQKCVAGSSVREICEYGDKLITDATSAVFKKEKELKKGNCFC